MWYTWLHYYNLFEVEFYISSVTVISCYVMQFDGIFICYVQAGPLEQVKIVAPPNGGVHYAFITFKHPCSVPYTMHLMNGIRLFDKPLRLQERTGTNGSNSSPSTPAPNPMRPSLTTPGSLPSNIPTNIHVQENSGFFMSPNVHSQLPASLQRSYSVPDTSRNAQQRSRPSSRDATPYARPPSHNHRSSHGHREESLSRHTHAVRQLNSMMGSHSHHSTQHPQQWMTMQGSQFGGNRRMY